MQTRRQARASANLRSQAVNAFTAITITLIAAIVCGWVAINAITGCGEVTHDIYGGEHHGHCVLVPWASTEVSQ